MIIQSATFIKSSTMLSQCPDPDKPEFAFIGRSNVGKSSLINMVTGWSKLAKTSGQPGKTRTINHFEINEEWYLADLPGYGYAKVSKGERDAWQRLLDKYFYINKFIKLAIHLIDSRHEPTILDIDLHNFLKLKNIPFFILLNKSDKLKQSELAIMKKKIIQFFPELIYGENFLFYSAIKGTGKKEVMKLVSELFIT